MPNSRHEFRLRAGAGGTGDIDMLPDQPATEAHPHGQVAQHAVLDLGVVILAQVGQGRLLAVASTIKLIDHPGALAHTAAGVELDAAAHGDSQSWSC